MHALFIGLLAYVLFYILFWAISSLVVVALPESFLGRKAAGVLAWLPPFIRGETLRQWAATTTEQLAQRRLDGERTGEMAAQLAREVEEGAMRAMLPMSESAELNRVVACPKDGQGVIGVTAPEVLAIAEYVRKKLPHAEQERIFKLAVANAEKLIAGTPGEIRLPIFPCPLLGENQVCCVYAARPLRCRPLHAISIARGSGQRGEACPCSPVDAPEEYRHAQTVAEGVAIGLSKAIEAARLSTKIYELNSALAVALDQPDAAERWAGGEDVFAHAVGVPTAMTVPTCDAGNTGL
jgi:hypothetical protein